MLETSLSELKQWGALRAVIRSEAGAISELFLQAGELALSGSQLKIENEHFHLHVDWSRVSGAWLVRRADRMCGIYFTDSFNQTVFNLSLLRKDGKFDSHARQQFEQLWQQFSYSEEEELAVNE